MERCSYCRQGRSEKGSIVHKTGCPQVIPAFMHKYRKGWDDGRTWKPEASQDPTYVIGYGNGVCSAEEAENGERPY